MGDDEYTLGQQWRDAVAERRFCSSYLLVADVEGGPPIFECECGQFTGVYPNSSVGQATLDEHLDAQGPAWQIFVREWWAQKLPDVGMRVRASLGTGADVDMISVAPRADEREN